MSVGLWELFVWICPRQGYQRVLCISFPTLKYFSRLFLRKMNFEDVEERDGVFSVLSRPGGLIP